MTNITTTSSQKETFPISVLPPRQEEGCSAVSLDFSGARSIPVTQEVFLFVNLQFIWWKSHNTPSYRHVACGMQLGVG